MTTVRRWDAMALFSLGAAAIVTLALYVRLPDPFPTHFDLHGNPDKWMPRAIGAWVGPAIGAGTWLFTRFVMRILPRGDRARLPLQTVAFVAMLTATFVAAIHLVILYVVLVPGTLVTRPVFFLAGVLFLILGLVLPRVRRNPIIGIRTPWTLTSDENWARTHRVAGYSMVIGGITGAIAGAFGGGAGAVAALACFLLSAFVPAVYSLAIARRQDPG